jgi:hypothetical protein
MAGGTVVSCVIVNDENAAVSPPDANDASSPAPSRFSAVSAMPDSDSSKSSLSSSSLCSGTVGSWLTDHGNGFSGFLALRVVLAAVPDFCDSSNPDGFSSEKPQSVSSVVVDSTNLALSGEDGVPSPPDGAFFMVKDGWLHEGRRTDSPRKRTTDRTKNNNLSLSNCVLLESKGYCFPCQHLIHSHGASSNTFTVFYAAATALEMPV